jgi:tetratricopeptide (TPR) repeat protein
MQVQMPSTQSVPPPPEFPKLPEVPPPNDFSVSVEAQQILQLAYSHIQAGHHSQAIDLLEQAVQRDTEYFAAKSMLGKLYLLEHSPASIRRALIHLKSAQSLRPEDTDTALQIVFAYVELQDWFQAKDAIQRTEALALDPEIAAFINFLKGYIAKTEKQYVQAGEFYRKAIQIFPDWSVPYEYLARLFIEHSEAEGEDRQKNLNEALKLYQRVNVIQPDNSSALINSGWILHELGRQQDALAIYERAVESDPNNVLALMNLASEMVAIGRLDDALPLYERLSADDSLSDPIKTEICNGLGLVRLRLALKENDASRRSMLMEQSIHALSKAIALKPDRYDILVSLALAYQFSGDTDNALGFYKESLKIAPGNSLALSNLTNYFTYLQSELSRQRKEVNSGHPTYPSDARPRFGSGQGLISVGEDFNQPLEEFEEYM